MAPKNKVTPLKTVQHLRTVQVLLEDELACKREEILRLQEEKEQLILRNFKEREGLAKLFIDIRSLASTVDELGPMPLSVRLRTMIFPAFMLKMAMRKTRVTIWTEIVTKLNEFHYSKHEAVVVPPWTSPAMATTIKVEKGKN